MNQEKLKCSECGNNINKNEASYIDNRCFCSKCLYGDINPVKIYPVGIIKNDLKRKKNGFGVTGSRAVSRIELISSQKRFIYKLEEEKYLTIVYYLHKARPVRSIFNRGLDGKKVGVFASRTPDRLSKIGIQDVQLIKIEDTTLFVEGLDAINGTPVLDIKLKFF